MSANHPLTRHLYGDLMRLFRRVAPLVMVLAAVGSAPAVTRYVSPAGTNDVAGGFTTWAGAATTIQAAVDVAQAGDTVRVTNTTYLLAAPVTITNGITLAGNGAPEDDRAVLDGGGATRCFNMQHASAVIQGFVISNGYVNAAQAGGGGYVKGGTVTNCVVTANLSTNTGAHSFGGGLYVENGTVRNCVILGNTAAGEGAGMHVKNSLVEDCRIITNKIARFGSQSFYAAGIDVDNSDVRRCEIAWNNGSTWGGGARLNGANAKMTGCQVASNSSVGAGGI